MTQNELLILPLVPRTGTLLNPLVASGETVSMGQKLAVAIPAVDGVVDPAGGPAPASTLHSPVNGVVAGLAEHEALVSGRIETVTCLSIRPTLAPEQSLADLVKAVHIATDADRLQLVEKIAAVLPSRLAQLATPAGRATAFDTIASESGLTGLGGGGFPLHAKLRTDLQRLVINAAECEPYAGADNALMQSAAPDVIAGCWLACQLLELEELSFAIKETLDDARSQLEYAESKLRSLINAGAGSPNLPPLHKVAVSARYPAGAEQQVVKQAFGIEIPADQRASQAGVVCINVSTIAALGRFLLYGHALTYRIITVAGSALGQPGDYLTPIGLPAAVLLQAAGLNEDKLLALVHGGGMMGTALPHADIPLGKSSYCLIAAGKGDEGLAIRNAIQLRSGARADTSPCIRCGFCEPACPVGLLPQQLHLAALADDSDWLQAHHLSACIECGACEAVCPSQLPLVDEFRSAKALESANLLARNRAEHARRRFEQRTERLRIEALEREAKRAARKAALGRKQAHR